MSDGTKAGDGDPIGKLIIDTSIDDWDLGADGYSAVDDAIKGVLGILLTPRALDALWDSGDFREITSPATSQVEKLVWGQILWVAKEGRWEARTFDPDLERPADIEIRVDSGAAGMVKTVCLRELLRERLPREKWTRTASILRDIADELEGRA